MLLTRGAPRLAAPALLSLSLALGGCTLFFDHDEEPCDIDGTTELAPVFADAGGDVRDVAESGQVPLISAPQGGFILLVAPRVRVASPSCQLQINAALREPATNRVVGLEERPIVVHRRADGWATPNDPAGLSDLANVAVCPNAVTTAVDGSPFRLEIRILDASGGVTLAQTAATVRPSCASDGCRSTCAIN